MSLSALRLPPGSRYNPAFGGEVLHPLEDAGFPGILQPGRPLHGACMATCPECEFDEIDTTAHEEGDELSCPECGKTLVLSGPDELEIAADDDEDEDEDDDLGDDEEDEEVEDDEEGLFDEEDDLDEEEDE